MTRLLLAGAAALGMMTVASMAQTNAPTQTGSQQAVSTSVSPALPPPGSGPVTISSGANTENALKKDGDLTSASGTVARDTAGNTTETSVTNTTYPFSNMITTTKKAATTVNGVTTENVTTTQAFPNSAAMPAPPPMTSTQTTVKPAGQ
jgi:hypothetical protein